MAQTKIEKLAGVKEGAELNGEIIVADYDDNGHLIGWHKETKGTK